MKSHSCEPCAPNDDTGKNRRKFLQASAIAAGGLIFGLQATTQADESSGAPSTPVSDGAAAGEFLVALPPEVLEKVGGFEVVETPTDKIIVARTGPASIVACSAICTHKGCTVGYEHDAKQFVCPCHGARYELTGKVVKGPAKRDLKSYQTRPVLGLSTPTAMENPK
jgi:cytochrome b6-f complex iron-sulfur subunit